MDTGQKLGPLEYLDRFFDEIRAEARDNPAFAARLIEALGGEAVFPDEVKRDLLNPLAEAARESEAAFKSRFDSLKSADLKWLFRTYNLASPIDLRGLDRAGMLDLLYARARAKAEERQSE